MDEELKELLKLSITQQIANNIQANQPVVRYAEPTYEIEYEDDCEEYYEPTRLESLIKFASSWQLTLIMIYIAIAEVLAPGHNGLTGITDMHWFWGPRAIAGLVNVELPTPEVKIAETTEVATGETKPIEEVAEPEKILDAEPIAIKTPEAEEESTPEGYTLIAPPRGALVSCGRDSNGGDFARFDIDGTDFQLNNVMSCYRGVKRNGDTIAILSNASSLLVSRDGIVEPEKYTRDHLEDWGLLK